MKGSRFALALTIVIAIAAILRILCIEVNSIWRDEFAQLSAYYADFDGMLAIAASHMQPPLDYLIGWGLRHLGIIEHDWGVRLSAFTFGVGSLIVLAIWLRKFAGDLATLVIVTIVAINPMHVQLSVEGRPYTIFLFFFLLSGLWLTKALLENHRRDWVYFGIAGSLFFLTRGLGPNVAFLCFVCCAIAYLFFYARSASSLSANTKSIARHLTVTHLFIGIFVAIPTWRMLLLGSASGRDFEPGNGTPFSVLIDNSSQLLTQTIDLIFGTHTPMLQIYFAISGVVLLAYHLTRATWDQKAYGFLFLAVTGCYAFVYVVPYNLTQKVSSVGKPGYLQPFAIFLLTGYGYLIAYAARRMQASASNSFRRALVTSLGIVVVAASVWHYVPAWKLTSSLMHEPIRNQWREALVEIKRDYGSENGLFVGIRAGYNRYIPYFLGADRYVAKSVTTTNIRLLKTMIQNDISVLNHRNIHVSIMNHHIDDRFKLADDVVLPEPVKMTRVRGLTIFHIVDAGENGARNFLTFLKWLATTNTPQQWVDAYTAIAEIERQLGNASVAEHYQTLAKEMLPASFK